MKPVTDSLVLYKVRPARVLSVGEKVEIEFEGGHVKKVRPKDIEVLHPGPLRDLSELVPQEGELEAAWSLLEGSVTHLAELTELIYTEFTPPTAWATWQWVADGLFFKGTPESIQVRSRKMVEQDRRDRTEREAARRAWLDFIARLQAGACLPEDMPRLEEVERVALGQSDHSRILETLKRQVNKENAHRLLLLVGYWQPNYNPYPARCRINSTSITATIPSLPIEERRDLTHLSAYAIDNIGNQDPDDAISLDGEYLWIHVADVAALVPPDSELDQEARARGANLYIPEGIVPMLPDAITRTLGLGLQEISPALSLRVHMATDGTIASLPNGTVDLEVCPSWVRVQRISYQAVEGLLEQEPFASLLRLTNIFRTRRLAQGATSIDLPEVDIKLVDGEVRIVPMEHLRSRELVTDAMLLAGEAVASYCQQHQIPIPFVIQSPPEYPKNPTDLAGMWAYRKQLKPSRLSVEASLHSGLGLPLYTRATSPLRRYSDLLVHQQLRAHLVGNTLLTNEQIAERFDVAEMGSITTRRAERLSNNHWKMLWFKQHPQWQGEAVVVDQDQDRVVAIIPELALENKVRVQGGAALNAKLSLKLREVDIPELTCYFTARIKEFTPPANPLDKREGE